MFQSLIDLTKDVATIATTPIELVADTARLVTKPLADASKDIVESVKSETKES